MVSLGQRPSASPPSKQQDQEEVVRITTNLVQVDAVVTDKNGKPVTDLKPEEVQILEDGKRQKISHFSYIVTGSAATAPMSKPAATDKNAPPVPPVALKRDQVRRTIAIVIDDLGLSFVSTTFVRRALKKFVDDQIQPGDLVAIIRTAGGIGVLQQFTSDKRQLYAAVEQVKWYPNGRAGILAVPSTGTDSFADSIKSAGGAQVPTEDVTQYVAQVLSVGTLGAVNYVIGGLRELPGRKSILLISDGFQINNSYSVEESLRHLIDQASRASVVIYTLNATELQTLGITATDFATGYDPFTTPPDQRGARQLADRRTAVLNLQEGLDYLAKETGGIAIRNTNDLSGGISRVMEDQNSYYLIGYRPDESTFDPASGRRAFHKLSLKITRPGSFKLRMREGFYGASDEESNSKPRTAQQQMIAGLKSPFGAVGVHVRLTSLFGNTAKFGSYMRSMLYVNAGDLTFTEDPGSYHKAELNLLAIAFGDNGNPVEQISGPAIVRVPDYDFQRFLSKGFVYFLTVPIKKPGAYQLRVALRDEGSGRVGSASQFVEVPDIKKNRLTLSGLAATADEPSGVRQNTTAKQSQNDERQEVFDPAESAPNTRLRLLVRDSTDPMNSAAVRQFHSGQILKYGFVIFNARLDKAASMPQVRVEIRMFREGQAVFTGKDEPINLTNQSDMKRLNVSGTIHLGTNLTPGEYVLQVIVTDQLSDEKHRVATQWMDFEIVK
jgi:VWFA-related protein